VCLEEAPEAGGLRCAAPPPAHFICRSCLQDHVRSKVAALAVLRQSGGNIPCPAGGCPRAWRMEAMEEAGVQLGLDRKTASLLSQQTALGAGRIAIESPEDPSELRRRVTSPGGTTERAIATFEAGGFSDLVLRAMNAAKDRAEVLSKELGGDA
jgi:hypothetical protein